MSQSFEILRQGDIADGAERGTPVRREPAKPVNKSRAELELCAPGVEIPKSGQPLTPEEVRALDQRFNQQPTEQILAWAWERYGSRAAIGTSFQGAGLVMMHLAKQN